MVGAELYPAPVRELLALTESLLCERDRVVVALEGRCAAGKSTLAANWQRAWDDYAASADLGCAPCQVLHMDDFFLRPQQRTAERRREPGGNVDRERFLEEVLLPLSQGRSFVYRPYDCHRQQLEPGFTRTPGALNIVEGSYSCHPLLWDCYDCHLFLDIDKDTQRQRLIARNGPDGWERFRDLWIPLEEAYLEAFRVSERCEWRWPRLR